MIFTTNLSFTEKIPDDGIIQGFISYPIKEVDEDGELTMEKCEPAEAEGYAIYALVERGEREWIADVATAADADRFKVLLQNVYRAGKSAESIQKHAELNGWKYLETHDLFFDPKTGNTYQDDINDPIHLDDIDMHEWFGSLDPGEMKILEEYWLSRTCIFRGENASAYPYRYLGDGLFQIHESNGEWVDADPINFVIGSRCWIRTELITEGVKVPLGKHYTQYRGAFPYMWVNNDETFLVWHWEKWNEAQSIDFTFDDPTVKDQVS